MKQFIRILTIGILCLIGVTTHAADPNTDLILYFSFDEGNGNKATDASPNKFDGDVKNGKWIDGVVGKAIELNNGAVTAPALKTNEPAEMTIEFWFKPAEKIEGGGRIDLMYRLNGGGRPHITFNRGGVLFGYYFGDPEQELKLERIAWEPQWYYYVATQTKKEVVVYIDGEVDVSGKQGNSVRLDYITEGISIGANTGGSNFFNGAIDEVKIWSVALTADEVSKSMASALAVEASRKLTTMWGHIKSAR